MAEPLRRPPADWETEPASPGADPFRYGWRIRHVRLPSGEVTEQQIPLTPEDLLDPQLGDVVVQSVDHYWEAHDVAGPLRDHFTSREDVLVTSDVKMLWGIPDLAEPAPDVAVIFGIRDKKAKRESFNCVAEGTRPSLVIEVVSSRDAAVRRNDYEHKPGIYEEAGVPEYLIFDPPGPLTKNRWLLTGYRLGPGRKYQPIQPDARGFLPSQMTALLFGVSKDGQALRVVDAATGERLLTSQERKDAQRAAEERAKAAEAENARLRAELERYRGQ
jgi:Uma2 family endonuclease